MVKFGMTPVQAIRAATMGAATLMGWADRVGSWKPASSPTCGGSGDPTEEHH